MGCKRLTYSTTEPILKVAYSKISNAQNPHVNYFPFGMLMPNRHGSTREAYDRGFNGQLKDDEIKGEGNSYDFGARMFDPRIGRFLSRDPMEKRFAFQSPYLFASNNPILYIDKNGEYSVEVHYEIAHKAAIKLGYSKEMAHKIAYMASTYADMPDPEIMPMLLGTVNNGKHLKYGQFGVNYGQGKTKDSQLDDSEHAKWHSMRSTKDVKNGMTQEQAKENGMSFGLDMIISASQTGSVEDLGQGLHALMDADAHEGASMEQHLGKDEHDHYTKEAKGMLFNDQYGNHDDADKWTSSGLMIYGILSGDKDLISKMTNDKGQINLDLSGMSVNNISKIKSAFEQKGITNVVINNETEKGK